MNKKLDYSISCQRISTATKYDTSNVHQLSLGLIETQNLLSDDRFTNIQSLSLSGIADDVTYDQLDTFLNMSSIQHIIFQSQINSKLFFDILKYNTALISLEINCNHLMSMLRTEKNYYRHQIRLQLKKIKKLTLRYSLIGVIVSESYIQFRRKEMKNICYLFSNVEQLIIKGRLESIELIPLVLHELKYISFFSVYCTKLEQIGKKNIRQWLINHSRRKLNEKNFICKQLEYRFDIWID